MKTIYVIKFKALDNSLSTLVLKTQSDVNALVRDFKQDEKVEYLSFPAEVTDEEFDQLFGGKSKGWDSKKIMEKLPDAETRIIAVTKMETKNEHKKKSTTIRKSSDRKASKKPVAISKKSPTKKVPKK
jgi:hypothetical protein